MRRLSILLFASVLHADEPLPGHSHQGHAFNEGPRQEATLFEGNGSVHLPITTDWGGGQSFFNQGLGQLHGFWYYEAERSFRQIAAHDPDCAMAYWGMAMANWENPKRAKGFIEKAATLQYLGTLQEQMYIEAQANFLDDIPKAQKKRRQELLHDLEDLIHEYPNDLEAKAFLACRIWQFSRKGIPIPSHEAVDALLQQVFTKAPEHPAHHYRIHLWDKHKAERALDSAAKLGATAPAIAHMWHMPGHIYSQLGRFEDAVWHQQASARRDHAYMRYRMIIPDQIHNYAHNNEWLARNWIHLGNAANAMATAKSLLTNPRHPKLNSLEGKAHSYRFGRERLIEVLEQFELWTEVLVLAQQPWLEALPEPRHELLRLRLIGLAQFHLDQKDYLEKTIADIKSLLEKSRKEQRSARDEARKNAAGKPQKKVDRLVEIADEPHGQQIEKITRTIDELESCLAALDGDRKAALDALEKSQSPDFAKALRYLALSEFEKAGELSKSAIDGGKHQTLPLAARIEVLHALGRHDDARERFDELRHQSSQLDLELPPFARLQAIAEQYDLPADWTLAYEIPADFGERPYAKSLGPLNWQSPRAPDFDLENSGLWSSVSLHHLRDRPIILIFYLGYRCRHCAEQLDAVAERIEDFEKRGFQVVAISTDSKEQLRQAEGNYLDTYQSVPFTLLTDPEMSTFRAYGAYDDFEKQTLHATFLISPLGRILWTDIAADPFMDLDFLLKESDRLLKLHRH